MDTCAHAKKDDAIASFDVNGNTGSTAYGFLERIGCDFTTNRSHRAVDFFLHREQRDCERNELRDKILLQRYYLSDFV